MKAATFVSKSPGVIISLIVAFAFGVWSIFLGQDKNWDLLNYHLYNPYAFLNDRIEFDLAPAGLQSFFSPVLDVIYFTAISHLSPRVVGFLLGFIHGLNFFLVYKIAGNILKQQALKDVYALCLALAGVLSVGFLAEVGTTLHDSLVALFPLLSLWMITSAIGSLNQDNQRPVLALVTGAGLVAGIGIGLKLVAAIYALPLCLSFLVLPVPVFRRLGLSFIFGLAVLAGLFLTGGYWLFEMWRLFGNPLFPQFNNYFHGELAAFHETRDVRFLPETLFDKVFYPIIFTFDPQRVAELKFQQFNWLFAYIAFVGLLVDKLIRLFRKGTDQRQKRPEAAFLLTFFCISYLLWLNIFGIYRYLVVIELLIPLLLFVIITYIFRFKASRWIALLCVAVLTVVNIRGAPDWGHVEWADTVYAIEENGLTDIAEPAVIYLAGQPLAWIVPALDIAVPFIQIVPNMTVSEAYWQRANILTADRVGKRFVIYESDSPDTLARSQTAMVKLGISVVDSNCGKVGAFLGGSRIEYKFCEVRQTESK